MRYPDCPVAPGDRCGDFEPGGRAMTIIGGVLLLPGLAFAGFGLWRR